MRLALLVAAFVAGVALARLVSVEWTAVGLIAGAAVAVLVVSRGFGRVRPVATALLLVAVGAGWVALASEDNLDALAPLHAAGAVLVRGVVAEEPERAGQAFRLVIAVTSVDSGDGPVVSDGRLLATVNAPSVSPPDEASSSSPGLSSAPTSSPRDGLPFRRGDRLALMGRLSDPPGAEQLGFDYPAYLARQGIGSVMNFPEVTIEEEGAVGGPSRWLSDLRRRLSESILRTVPGPGASVGKAVLLGLRDDLPGPLVEDFRRSGASHLLAVSGLHVGVVMGLALVLSRGLMGRRRHLYLAVPLLAVWLYAGLAGMSPTVTRAAIMGTVYLAALLVGRPGAALPSLAAAVAIMVAVDPAIVEDVSFQLSVVAVTGIALLARPLAGWSAARLGLDHVGAGPVSSLARAILALAAVTVVATLATFPIVALNFQAVSLVGVPVTLLVLPALPFVLVGQAVAAVGGLAGGPIGDLVGVPLGWLAWLPTRYLTGVVEAAARLPGASFQTGSFTPALVAAYYVVCLLAVFAVRGRLRRYGLSAASGSGRPFRPRGLRPIAIAALVAGCVLLWVAASSGGGDGRLRVTFLDVGEGDAVYIETPSGGRILVDGGPDPLGAVKLLGERAGPGRRTVDLVILTHPHADHLGGLVEVLARYDVRYVIERRIEHAGPLYASWRRAVEQEGAVTISAVAGTRLLVDGVLIEVLWPGVAPPTDANDASVVLRLSYGDVSFLLTGDVSAVGERAMIRSGVDLDADVLKVAHHGSRTSSSRVFLAAVGPRVAVISVGAENRFGHPDPAVLGSLGDTVPGALLLRTDRDGTIEMATDGRRLWVTRLPNGR